MIRERRVVPDTVVVAKGSRDWATEEVVLSRPWWDYKAVFILDLFFVN